MKQEKYGENTKVRPQNSGGVDNILDKNWLLTPGDVDDFIFYYQKEEISQK